MPISSKISWNEAQYFGFVMKVIDQCDIKVFLRQFYKKKKIGSKACIRHDHYLCEKKATHQSSVSRKSGRKVDSKNYQTD